MKLFKFLKEYWDLIIPYLLILIGWLAMQSCVVICSDPKSALCIFWLIGGSLLGVIISTEAVIRILYNWNNLERIAILIPFWMVMIYLLFRLYTI